MMKESKTAIAYIIFIGVIFFHGISLGQDINITASIDRSKIAVNQVYTYTLQVSGSKANSIKSDPVLPDMKEFSTYMGSSGTSQNIQLINGRMSISKSYSFNYMATKVGTYEIGPAKVEFKGKSYNSNSLTIEVVASAAQPKAGGSPGTSQQSRSQQSIDNQKDLEDNLLLRAFINKRKVYVNEPVILTYKIYTAVTVTSYGVSKQPDTEGFWVEEFEIANPPQTTRENYKGREYIVAEIRKMALFPTDAGNKTIGPMHIQCDVRVQSQRRSIFDSFFDDPFFGRSVKASVYAPPIEIEVLPLPEENKPLNFSGLVGNFKISANVDKTRVKANEAISLKVKLSGEGNIKLLPEPNVIIPPQFEKYDPRISRNVNRSGNGISGSKTLEYVLIPRYAGQHQIKPIEFNYYDPINAQYRTVSTREISINVEKGDEDIAIAGAGFSKEEVKLVGQDIRFIQRTTPDLKRSGYYFYKNPLFYLGLIIPLILLIAAMFQRRQMDKISENEAYARNRRANQLAKKRLKHARSSLSEDTQKEYYAETSRALIGYLADKLNVSAAGVMSDQLESMMRGKALDEDIIKSFMDCISVCDYQRFAPSNSTYEEMSELYEQSKIVISKIEKSIK